MSEKKKIRGSFGGLSLEDQLFYVGAGVFAAAAVFVCLWLTFMGTRSVLAPCIWNTCFHIYCPGCGGTRAVLALLKGDFLGSLWYHPLVPYAAVLYGCFMGSHLASRLTGRRFFRGMRFHSWYLFAAVGIVAVNFVVKNLLLLVWGVEMV